MKLQFWKTCISHHKLGSFPILKASSDKVGRDVNECEFLILYTNICNSELIFSKWLMQCYKIVHKLKIHLKCKDKTNVFSWNRTWKVHWFILDSTLHLTLKKLPLSSFTGGSKKNSHIFLKKLFLNISLFPPTTKFFFHIVQLHICSKLSAIILFVWGEKIAVWHKICYLC